MHRNTHWPALLLLGAATILSACGPKTPPLTRLEPDALYERGMSAFQAEQYGRAIAPLQLFAQQQLGDARVPTALFSLGRAHVERREYLPAITEFQRLVTDYPTHELAPEGRFGMCDAYVRLSPRPTLDQEYTYAAIAHCQSVAELFPGTDHGTTAAASVSDLRGKLAAKTFQSGLFYFRRRAFDAAVVYFEDVVTQFPQTEYAPAALLKLAESYDGIGYVEEAAAARERLVQEYPQSAEAQASRA